MVPRVHAALRAIPLALLPLIVVACAVPGPRYHGVSPIPEGADRTAAIELSASTLQSRGYTPSVINERVGTLTTDWRTNDSWFSYLFGRRVRDRLTLTVSDSLLKLTGEYQVRDGPSFFAAFDEKSRDTGWFNAAPPVEVRAEWDAIRAELVSLIASAPRAKPVKVDETTVALRRAPVSPDELPYVAPVPVGERVRVAVAGFEGIGLTHGDVTILTDRLRAELVDTGRFLVIERERMNEILDEQGFQHGGLCATDECVVEIGRLIGVNNIVAGTFGKLGETYTVTARLIDVETGAIHARASYDCQCVIDELLQAMERISLLLASRME